MKMEEQVAVEAAVSKIKRTASEYRRATGRRVRMPVELHGTGVIKEVLNRIRTQQLASGCACGVLRLSENHCVVYIATHTDLVERSSMRKAWDDLSNARSNSENRRPGAVRPPATYNRRLRPQRFIASMDGSVSAA